MKAVKTKVILQIIEDTSKSTSGLTIKSSAAAPIKAKVISVGNTCESEMKAGDTVLFQARRGTQFRDKGESFYVMPEDNVDVIL